MLSSSESATKSVSQSEVLALFAGYGSDNESESDIDDNSNIMQIKKSEVNTINDLLRSSLFPDSDNGIFND